MMIKILVIFTLTASATAGRLPFSSRYTSPYHQPDYTIQNTDPAYVNTYATPVLKHKEYEAPPTYEFSYSVNDPTTGDVKEQAESRDGDVVHGYYTLNDPDGYKRIVEYTVDGQNGFQAVVRREPLGVYPSSTTKGLPSLNSAFSKFSSPVGQYSSTNNVDSGEKLVGFSNNRGYYAATPINYYHR